VHTNLNTVPVIEHADIISIRMQVARNPVSDLINIVFDNYEETAALDYEVADNTGKIMLHGYWPVNKGPNKTIINLSLLAAGSYRLSIRDKANNDLLLSQMV
jgi:hypothetical protein